MGNVGIWEIMLVLLVALLVFGPKRLPEMGRSLGRGMREFKDSISGMGNENDDNDDDGDARAPRSGAAPEIAAASPIAVTTTASELGSASPAAVDATTAETEPVPAAREEPA